MIVVIITIYGMTKPVFSRRAFLQGLAAGVVVGGAAVGGSLTLLRREPVYWRMPERWDIEADVVIAGFGVAGAAAAAEAAGGGASVIVFDKSPTPGGNGAMSGGNISLVNSSIQREKGLAVDPDTWLSSVRPVMEKTFWEPSFPERETKYVANAGKEVGDWLFELGLEYDSVASTTLRVKGGGPALVSALQKTARSRGVRVETEAKVVLVQLVARPDNIMVLGAIAERNGSRLFVKARKAVILTTGGFADI